MSRLLLFVLFSGLISCRSASDVKQTDANLRYLLKEQLAGEGYFATPGYDANKCTEEGHFDFCSMELLFVNDSIFLHISNCMLNISIVKGIYKTDGDGIILKYGEVQVKRTYKW